LRLPFFGDEGAVVEAQICVEECSANAVLVQVREAPMVRVSSPMARGGLDSRLQWF